MYKGKKGEEGDVEKYEVKGTEVTQDAGALRITSIGVRRFSVGPPASGEYTGFFPPARQKDVKECGFSLIAAGAPVKAAPWVLFTDVRVVKH